MDKDFYTYNDFKYPEIGICMEDSKGPYVKINIPIATPALSGGSAYDSKDFGTNTRNIVSTKTASGVSSCVTSNYIEVKMPPEFFEMKKGDKVVMIFIGGDINKPVLLRRYFE